MKSALPSTVRFVGLTISLGVIHLVVFMLLTHETRYWGEEAGYLELPWPRNVIDASIQFFGAPFSVILRSFGGDEHGSAFWLGPIDSLLIGVLAALTVELVLGNRRYRTSKRAVALASSLVLLSSFGVTSSAGSDGVRASPVGVTARNADLDAGPHDLRAFLWREQGSHVAALPEIQVEVRGVLPTLLAASRAWSASQRLQTESAR